ncbi:MAG: hypothetical protein ACLQGP_34810 [Isosphaeraceae bacterium]
MRFYKRELYLQFTATDIAIADRADVEWEHAVSDYHAHLGRFSSTMNDRVRKFAEELCLHETELLALQEEVVRSPALNPTQTPVAIVSLRGIGRIFNLFYLSWGESSLSTAPESWPFSPIRLQWLYDEIDLDPEPSSFPRYYHHIMLSDGRELSIPFYDVIVHSFPDKAPEPAIVTRRKARADTPAD